MVDRAERSLTDGGRDASTEMENEMMNKDKERLESVKAASVSAVIGTLAELPISLTRVTSNSELILPLAITFVSCALFGVTFRYAIRRDLDNFQLKSGTSAAFGFVKGTNEYYSLSSEICCSHLLYGICFFFAKLSFYLN